ncbi:hypothetical protein HPB51_005007 [Rhipicephalus microplus]|uniref:Uncharacterized protein n=1 Tax=Rhipicephalus microplus TaxID=6941 RepID=A0A9J6DZ06_RHIMP|nr:hypothetical protein HPB51_005007 [Rhipicephalus microplus]
MTSSRAPRTMWTDDEITTLLALVNEKKLSDSLDSKRQKNKDIRLRIRLRRALCRNRTTAAIALCSVSQDTNTTIKYSWCKLRKNTKTAIAVAERQLRKQPQPTAARGESASLEERKPVPEDGLLARLDAKRRCDHHSPQLVRASSYKLGRVETEDDAPERMPLLKFMPGLKGSIYFIRNFNTAAVNVADRRRQLRCRWEAALTSDEVAD